MKLDVDIYMKQGRFLLDAQFKCFESALGIFGPSGCGKSTLFRALAGLARPHGGHIVLDGKTLFDSAGHIFVPPHKRNIGLVFQDARLFPHWSVEKNLRAGECLKERVADRPFGFDDIAGLLNIGHLIGRSVEDLSGGEKQRIAIGRALLSNPRLLLMDEPVTGLDVSLKAQILPFLAKVHRALRIPTILISHDLGEILQLTDQLMLMREGTVTGFGTLDQLATRPDTLQELNGADLTNMISARIREHCPGHGTTRLELPGSEHTLTMELTEQRQAGQTVVLGIAANQIALAPGRIDAISMRNQLPGTVEKIVHTPARSLCSLSTPAGPLFVEITPGTETDLQLHEGKQVWILFKSRALEQIGGPEHL
ncbi:molybdenum ABC transporter ATP-binding protein [Pontiellaceae bacterium B12227]|nr:molybdenum ABC transporter ATP-binding protein [Pontiellaceae bacterium B12227]